MRAEPVDIFIVKGSDRIGRSVINGVSVDGIRWVKDNLVTKHHEFRSSVVSNEALDELIELMEAAGLKLDIR